MKTFIFVCFLVAVAIACFGHGPVQVRTEQLPVEARLDAIYFENTQQGFVRACCGKDNKILETSDGGRSWQRSEVPVRGLRRGRVFANGLNGWSVVEDAAPHTSLYQTADGGKTWKLVLQAEKKGNFYFDAIQATSGSNVWALGLESFHTTDAGKSWKKVQVGYVSVDFLDSEHGWILGGEVFKTTDAGATWREFAVPKALFQVKPTYLLTDIYFIDSNHGWIVGGMNETNAHEGKNHGIILSTSDGGETWELLSHFEDRYLWSVFFLNEQVGWAAGLKGTFLKTEDGGKTWLESKTGQVIH